MSFYDDLPEITHISEITNLANYRDAPDDWCIAMNDIVDSTGAIQRGKYHEVNSLAAASITAMLNKIPIDFPFVFGGDGASMLIPNKYVEEAYKVMQATQKLAREQFNMELRAAIIPVPVLLTAGFKIRVAKHRISENYQQAVFTGGGVTHAEKIMKDPALGAIHMVTGEGDYADADFSGFECRWNAVRSPYDETLSLMVAATADSIGVQNAIYHDVLHKIEMIFGDTQQRHPIKIQHMHMKLNPLGLTNESRIRHRTRSLRRLFKMWRGSVKAMIGMRFNIRNWGSYKSIFIGATDSEKFDDMLRMIISGTAQQRTELTAYLEEQHRKNKLVYGIHIAEHALVTCIIFDYFGRQVHFVDAAGGGYAVAARQMKDQLKELARVKV